MKFQCIEKVKLQTKSDCIIGKLQINIYTPLKTLVLLTLN